MQTKVLFRDFGKMDHLIDFVMSTAERSISKFEHPAYEFRTNVVLSLARARTRMHRRPQFDCEVVVKIQGQPSVIVKKTSSDFYATVNHCMRLAEKKLRRNSKIHESSRRSSQAISMLA
jgi:ribosome-associated translation inhibitor RaiA